MKFTSIFRVSEQALVAIRLSVLAVIASLLVACGGGGVTSTAPSSEAVFIKDRRVLPAEYLARKAVAYSPFRTDDRDKEMKELRDPANQAKRDAFKADVVTDLNLLMQGNFRLIRLFDSSNEVAKLVLDVIVEKNLDMKVQLGAYVNTFETRIVGSNPNVIADIKAANEVELERAIRLANEYQSIVLAVSVGNETLVNWSVVPIDALTLARYIKKVRDRVKQPVTTDDNFLAFANPAPKPVLDQIDFAAIHIYPNIDTEFPDGPLYWDWKQLSVPAGPARAKAMMDASMVELRRQYAMVRVALDSMGLHEMPIAITETGWKAFDSEAPKQAQRAHPVNQKMFYQRLETLRAEGRVGAGPANIFYFEAFDEPWKRGDDAWGLFNVDRKARYVIQNLYDKSIWENALLTDANAVYFELPVAAAALASPTYVLFSDTPGAVQVSTLRIDAFDGNTVGRAINSAEASAAGQGTNSMLLTPAPKSWGWGLLWQPEARKTHEMPPSYSRNENLSIFAGGHINFHVKTTYAGKIEIGLSTLTETGESVEVLLPVGEGDYGYKRDGNWQSVKIPLQAFKTANPKLDLRFVVSPFYIADRYASTGKAQGSNITTPIRIDSVHWSR
jgi:exo-beta-1,3-glucanase (GH17 family)